MSDQLDVAYWREQVAKEPSIIGAGLVASLDEILRLRAERDALLPVVEAARAWVHCRPPQVLQEFHDALVAAVDALDHTAPETALSATQSAEEGSGAARGVGGAEVGGVAGYTDRAVNVVLTFQDQDGNEWLAAAVMTPLERFGETCDVADMPDRAFVLKGFKVVTDA